MKHASELVNLKPTPSTNRSRTPSRTSTKLGELFVRFGGIFYEKWTSRIPTGPKAKAVILSEWEQAIAPWSDEVIAAAIDDSRDFVQKNGWPPNIPEFRELCRAANRRMNQGKALKALIHRPDPDSEDVARHMKQIREALGGKP